MTKNLASGYKSVLKQDVRSAAALPVFLEFHAGKPMKIFQKMHAKYVRDKKTGNMQFSTFSMYTIDTIFRYETFLPKNFIATIPTVFKTTQNYTFFITRKEFLQEIYFKTIQAIFPTKRAQDGLKIRTKNCYKCVL